MRSLTRRNRAWIRPSDQAFQQELELADLDLDVEGVVEGVEDRDGQGPVVAVAFELVDDPAVLDLALADADLELARLLAGVAEVDVLDVGVDLVEVGPLVRARGCSGSGRASGPGRGRPGRGATAAAGSAVRVSEWVSTARTSPSRIA